MTTDKFLTDAAGRNVEARVRPYDPSRSITYADHAEWWRSLGYTPDGHVTHPMVEIGDLDAEPDDEDALCRALSRERGETVTPADLAEQRAADQEVERIHGTVDAMVACVVYGRQALEAARELERLLERAVAAWRDGDAEMCIEWLEDAQIAEYEYGDDPAVQELARQLLEPVEDDDEDDVDDVDDVIAVPQVDGARLLSPSDDEGVPR